MDNCVEPKPPENSRPDARLTITPGCSAASCRKLRPLSGNSSIWLRVTTPPMLVPRGSRADADSVTATCSLTPATVSVRLTDALVPMVTTTSSRVAGANPDNAATTL